MDTIKISMKAARVNANMRQEAAAKLLGISVNSLALFESGKAVPSWEIAGKMASVYGIPMNNINFAQKSA